MPLALVWSDLWQQKVSYDAVSRGLPGKFPLCNKSRVNYISDHATRQVLGHLNIGENVM